MNSEQALREQFDNLIEMWLRKTPHNNSIKTGIYIHGFIDGIYAMSAGFVDQETLPILTKVRNEVQRDYSKMFGSQLQFR